MLYLIISDSYKREEIRAFRPFLHHQFLKVSKSYDINI